MTSALSVRGDDSRRLQSADAACRGTASVQLRLGALLLALDSHWSDSEVLQTELGNGVKCLDGNGAGGSLVCEPWV